MNQNLLIVDDEPRVIGSIRRQLRTADYTIFSAGTGNAGLRVLEQEDIGVILSDLSMPGMDGITLLEQVRRLHPDTVRVLLTGHSSEHSALDAINRSQVFEYLTKPWSQEDLARTLTKSFAHFNLVAENRRLQRLTLAQNRQLEQINQGLEAQVRKRTRQLEEAVREGVMMLAKAAEAKDDHTGEHVGRIRLLTEQICRGLGLDEAQTRQIGLSSMMHDVGKIHIPDRILRKPGPLTEAELTIMKTHTTAGEKILGKTAFYRTAREIARSHHERWDGTGYPDGLKGEAIPWFARIVAVADIFDALTHVRPYKPAWSLDRTLAEMGRLSAKVFDPEILEVFFEQINAWPHGNGERRPNHGNRQ